MNPKRTILFTFAVLLISTSAQAQKPIKIGTANLKCYYNYESMRDTVKREYSKSDLLVLELGDNVSKFYSLNTHMLDSLNSAPDGYRVLAEMMSKGIASGNVPHRVFSAYIYRNYPEGMTTVLDNISTYLFIYEEPLPVQEWELLNDTTTVLGYSCQKAVCHFRGRDYQAWFTSEIPVDAGPWKFSGLPGLIMSVTDTAGHYSFTISGIKKIDNEPITFAKSPDAKSKPIKTTRQQFLRDWMGLGKDWNGLFQAESGMSFGAPTPNAKGGPVRDMIERDYR